jgi:hypothetical protein
VSKDKDKKQNVAAEGDVTREQSRYEITLQHSLSDAPALKLSTISRSLARSIALLAQENRLKVEVVAEAKPRVVKFKGVI